MNFDLSEEQQLLQATVGDFLAKECPPERLRAAFDADDPFDRDLWKGLLELGVGGIAVPEAYDGAGLELLDLALTAEALGYAAAPGPFLGHALATFAVCFAGSDAQKERWLPALASGDTLGTVALSEGDQTWQPEEWRLASGDRISGEKQWVPAGASADLIVVGLAGGGLALVESGATGFTSEPIDALDRTRRLDALSFQDTPCDVLRGGGAEAAGRLRDAALVLIAADACGGAHHLVEMSVDYAKTREQFGVPIGHFQALKHQLAEMAVAVEPTRALYWFAAHAFDHIPEEAPLAAALAKAHVVDRFVQVARDSVEAHGGIGYTWEGPVHIWFKRAMFDYAFLGTSRTHRARAAEIQGW